MLNMLRKRCEAWFLAELRSAEQSPLRLASKQHGRSRRSGSSRRNLNFDKEENGRV
jgi:hypothetical protein